MVSKGSIFSVHLFTFLACLLLVIYLALQLKGINELNGYIQKYASEQVNKATYLAEIERDIGYVGFIHNFKNYIIRGDEKYYSSALQNYEEARKSINDMKQLLTTKADLVLVESIETTIDEYHKMLMFAGENYTGDFGSDLDELVVVDDLAAKEALDRLRQQVLPAFERSQKAANIQANKLNESTVIHTVLIIPFVLFTLFFLRKVVKLLFIKSNELSVIFDATPNGIIYADSNGSILKVNQAVSKIFGYTDEELLTLSIEDLMEPNLRKRHQKLRENFLSEEQARSMADRLTVIEGVKKNGEFVRLNISIASTFIDNERRSVCVVKDLTTEADLQEKAEIDFLTGLKNRRAFEEMISIELDHNRREVSFGTLTIIDVDDFKIINDNQGHALGDKVLTTIARFIDSQVRPNDFVARWGGDEFILYSPNLNDKSATEIAERIRIGCEKLSKPDGYTVSIGIATSTINNKLSSEELFSLADKALYTAKENGRNQVIHYNTI